MSDDAFELSSNDQGDSTATRGRLVCRWLVGLTAGLSLLMGYSALHHVVFPNDKLVVLGKTIDGEWTPADKKVPWDAGLVVPPGFITNGHSSHDGEPPFDPGTSAFVSHLWGAEWVYLKAKNTNRIHSELVSRSVKNCLGITVLRWHCGVSGQISQDGSELYVSLTRWGRGDEGFTVIVDADLDAGNVLKLTITERLWIGSARQCRLFFRIRPDGSVVQIGAESNSRR